MAKPRTAVSLPGSPWSIECAVAKSFGSRFLGLMGKKGLEAGQGLLLYPSSSVHCFFMRFPIDVVYMSQDHRVIAVDRALRPWRVGKMHKGVKYVIEVTGGEASEVSPGHQLALEGWQPRPLLQRIRSLFARS